MLGTTALALVKHFLILEAARFGAGVPASQLLRVILGIWARTG